MLTSDQAKWIDSLSDRQILVVPYDPRSEDLFNKVRDRIHTILGHDVVVEHCGASGLGISGQDEIDVSIAVMKDKFADYIPLLEVEFGPVRSQYPDRARLEAREEGKKIDLKIVDMNHANYLRGKAFELHLRKYPEDLEAYRILKEEASGMSAKEYYRRKTEFINDILARA